MFAVTAGYHRYFSHRSYKLDRSAQFAMSALAQSSGQKDVLWWAAHHRQYHRYADGGPAGKRLTAPPSWSVAMKSGGLPPRAAAA